MRANCPAGSPFNSLHLLATQAVTKMIKKYLQNTGEAENQYKRVGNQVNQKLAFYFKSTLFMKRAKIMLSAIAVIATVGGVLAFKAQKFADQNVWCRTAEVGITCKSVAYKTNAQSGAATTTLPCLASHQVIFALTPTLTSSYFTTNTCPITTPVAGIVTTTNVQ